MTLRAIELSECRKVGVGVKRPEDVVVDRNGTVWLSDQLSACARLLPDGSMCAMPAVTSSAFCC